MAVAKKATSPQLSYQDFMSKVKKMEQGEKLDLSSDEDLSIAIMNLISMEEHLFFSGSKTNDPIYFELLAQIREMRKELLKKIIKEYEGEVWCISKHLLAASMRLMEVGTKMLTKKDAAAAAAMFKKSYQLYTLFWGLNLGVVKLTASGQLESDTELTLVNDSPANLAAKPAAVKKSSRSMEISTETEAGSTGKINLWDKLGELVKKAIDCCIE